MTFQQLQADAKKIQASLLREQVLDLIGSGETNAGDTLGCRDELPHEKRSEWDAIALDSVRGLLSSDPVNFHVFNWFARRISI